MCCASTRGDGANQWRLCANGGRGHAVALNADAPLTAVMDGSDPRRLHRSGLTRTVGEWADFSPWLHVLYRDSGKRAALNGLLEAGRRGWATTLAGSSSDAGLERESEALWELTASGRATIARLLKSEGFADRTIGRPSYPCCVGAGSLPWPSTSPGFRSVERGLDSHEPRPRLPAGRPSFQARNWLWVLREHPDADRVRQSRNPEVSALIHQ